MALQTVPTKRASSVSERRGTERGTLQDLEKILAQNPSDFRLLPNRHQHSLLLNLLNFAGSL